MKKFILGACAVVALLASSCSKGADKEEGFVADKAISDSVCSFVGQSTGGFVLNEYLRLSPEHQSAQTKKDILKGIQMVLANVDNDGMLMGLQIGGQIANQLSRIEAAGVQVDRQLFLREFRKAFENDTLDMAAIHEASNNVQRLMMQVEEQRNAAEAAATAAEEEAAGNDAASFFENLKAQDPDIVASPSGLYYKIINPGEGEKVGNESLVKVNYKGSLTDGTVFDQSAEGQPAQFPASGVIPGFAEGLKLLGKGGKAVLYIPGNLAYGPQGVPQAGIGPNATLIFDVEVVDIETPAE